ncbi:hypothetical protein V8D89_002527 [Ganoderma adspersum]
MPPRRARAALNGSYRKGLFFPKDANDPPTLRYWCNDCNDSVGRKADFDRHMRTHSDTFDFVCELSGCWQVGGGRGFTQDTNKSTHINNAHSSDNKFPCPHSWEYANGSIEACPVRFRCKRSLNSHRKEAHGFNEGDDPANVNIPTPEGSVFLSPEEASKKRGRGRRAVVVGAVMDIPAEWGDDDEAEVKFVQDTFADREGLKRFLDEHEVPYPTLPFKWPQGSSRGKVKRDKSSPESTPTPEHHYKLAMSLAASQAVYARPLPYPLAVNVSGSTLVSGPHAANHLRQQNAVNNAAPPVWTPLLFPPFAPGSALPSAQPATAPGMATVGGSPVVPQAAYNVASAGPASQTPPLQASYGTGVDVYYTAPTGVVPADPPSHVETHVLNAGIYPTSPPHSDSSLDSAITPPGGEGAVTTSFELSLGSMEATEFYYQGSLELSKWFPGGQKDVEEFFLGCQGRPLTT